jgi:hypothetical protein
MSAREKNPFVNHIFNVAPSALDIPRGSHQDQRPEPMQGAPRWARVAASDEGMRSVLEVAFGASEVSDADVQANLNQIRQFLGTMVSHIPPVDTMSPHHMKHGSDIISFPGRGVIEPVTDEVYELATLSDEPAIEALPPNNLDSTSEFRRILDEISDRAHNNELRQGEQ